MTTQDIVAQFKEQMAGSGAWVLCDAAESMKKWVKWQYPNRYDEEIRKFMTPRKFLLRDGEIIMVSLTDNDWGGIAAYSAEALIIHGIDQLMAVKPRGQGRHIVKIKDYQIADGVISITTHRGNIIQGDKLKASEAFYDALAATGYISRDEIAQYREPNNWGSLTLMKMN